MAYLPPSIKLISKHNSKSTIYILSVAQILYLEFAVKKKEIDSDSEGGGEKKECVTGAAGYLASWLIKRLLLSGYDVVGNEKKVAHLWRLEEVKERLRLVKADLMDKGSFDNALMGCSGVFHTASPVLKPSFDPKAEIIEPAIKGTLNVLHSCKKNPWLRRVVLTSSSSTVRAREDLDQRVPLDETSWSSVELCERLQIWYALSKTLAKKAAWDFCIENKIDLVTVLHTFVIGPSLPPELCSTASDFLGLLKGETEKFQWHGRMGYLHIDDVYENNDAHGQYLCSATVMDNDELVSFLSARYPLLPIPARFEPLNRPRYEFDSSKIRGLGFGFKPIEQMFESRPWSIKATSHHPRFSSG